MYNSNHDLLNNNSKVLHGVVESNNIGENEERVNVVLNLVVGDSNEKDEEHGPNMEEDKDCKGGNDI